MTLFCSGLVPGGETTARAQTAGDDLYAVLYCGSSDYYVYMNDLKFTFKTLVNDFGYSKDNILILKKGGGWSDLDGDGHNDIDFAATKVNADTVFARLKRVVTDGDVLFFYATDHGYQSTSDCNDAGLCVHEGSSISEDDLVAYLDGLDSESCRVTKIVMLNTCAAGGNDTGARRPR